MYLLHIYYGLNVCDRPYSYAEALTPSVAIFGDEPSKEVIKVKWGHRVGLCSDKISIFIRRDTGEWFSPSPSLSLSVSVCLSLCLFLSFLPRKGHARTQGEGGHLQARKRALIRNQNGQNIDHGLAASRGVRNKFMLFKASRLWYFIMAALPN